MAILQKLRQDILAMEGFRMPAENQRVHLGLDSIEEVFPNRVFPTGVIHEFISTEREDAAATSGFMCALLGRLMHRGGLCLWISRNRTLFPPALKFFGIDPDNVIFIDVKSEKDLLWMIEEALSCEALSAVVGEIKDISLTGSRRLQLAVEQSRVTGLLHRISPRNLMNTASVARWKISPLASELEEGLPGVGYARWNVRLERVRNGETGCWQLQWTDHFSRPALPAEQAAVLKTG